MEAEAECSEPRSAEKLFSPYLFFPYKISLDYMLWTWTFSRNNRNRTLMVAKSNAKVSGSHVPTEFNKNGYSIRTEPSSGLEKFFELLAISSGDL